MIQGRVKECFAGLRQWTSTKILTRYLVADSYFAKSEVMQAVTSLGIHFISRLRDDTVLFYLNWEPKTGKREGAKKVCRAGLIEMSGI